MQSSPGTDPGELSREDLVEELEEARRRAATAEDRQLRARADLENYRKRTERELERRVRDRGDELLRAWLEVLDSADRALEHTAGRPDVAEWLDALVDQMETILARQGVSRVGEKGEPFDPDRHEAVAVADGGDGAGPGTIAEVARSGYAQGDHVVRPAQVVVVRPSADGR